MTDFKIGDRVIVIEQELDGCEFCPPVDYEGVITGEDEIWFLATGKHELKIDEYRHNVPTTSIQLIQRKTTDPLPLPG
jgi:hypothetical protein